MYGYLRGMFAIAIFNWRESSEGQPPRLVLPHDPLGIKPMHIVQRETNPASVVFVRELRGLLASGLVPRAINRHALAEYLATSLVWQARIVSYGP